MSHTLWHSSPHIFDMPCIGLIESNRSNHANGLLGLWASVSPKWTRGFGDNLYLLKVKGNVKNLSVKDLAKMGPDTEPYIVMRQELLYFGVDILRIVECNGISEMSVIVNFDSIMELTRNPLLL